MSAKEIKYSAKAREKMLAGVDILADGVKVTLSPRGRIGYTSGAPGRHILGTRT